MEPPSPNWTAQLMVQAHECLHSVLEAHPEGTFDELIKNIVQAMVSNLDGDIDVESLTEDVNFSDIFTEILGVDVEDESTSFMGPNYSLYDVYQLANGKFAVISEIYEWNQYSVVAFDESLAAACQTIGEIGLAEFGENGNVFFNDNKVEPESTSERDETFWAELFEIAT
jgi:hypothetical protein